MPSLPGSAAFGRWITRRREDLGLSRRQLAELMDWHYETQGRLERGEKGIENRREMEALAAALQISVTKLRNAAVGADIHVADPEIAVGDEPTLQDLMREVVALREELAEALERLRSTEPGVLDEEEAAAVTEPVAEALDELEDDQPSGSDDPPNAQGPSRQGDRDRQRGA